MSGLNIPDWKVKRGTTWNLYYSFPAPPMATQEGVEILGQDAIDPADLAGRKAAVLNPAVDCLGRHLQATSAMVSGRCAPEVVSVDTVLDITAGLLVRERQCRVTGPAA